MSRTALTLARLLAALMPLMSAVFILTPAARAQTPTYPGGPVTLVVPFAAGSGTDSVSADSKRTGSRLASSKGRAAGHLKTRMSPFSTIVGPARI